MNRSFKRARKSDFSICRLSEESGHFAKAGFALGVFSYVARGWDERRIVVLA
jgi:hypothetical protein